VGDVINWIGLSIFGPGHQTFDGMTFKCALNIFGSHSWNNSFTGKILSFCPLS